MAEATGLEAVLLARLEAAGVRAERPAAPFEVTLADRRQVKYRPNLVLPAVRADGRPVVVEVFDAASPWGGVRRLVAFRRDWRGRAVLVVVAAPEVADGLPRESYDVLLVGPALDGLERLLAEWKGENGNDT